MNLGDAFVPVQLFAKRVEIAPSFGMQKTHLVLGALDNNSVSVEKTGQRLHVEISAGIPACYDFYGDFPGIRKHYRPI